MSTEPTEPTPQELLELEKKTFAKRAQLTVDQRSTPERLILRQTPRLRWFRFLISDGTFVDVRAVRDDSDLRRQIMSVLEKTRGEVSIWAELDLHPEHQPRPWTCSPPEAFFCTHHGDCICEIEDGHRILSHRCPLHGATDAAREHRAGLIQEKP